MTVDSDSHDISSPNSSGDRLVGHDDTRLLCLSSGGCYGGDDGGGGENSDGGENGDAGGVGDNGDGGGLIFDTITDNGEAEQTRLRHLKESSG